MVKILIKIGPTMFSSYNIVC